ncbi:MAG: hypothetical protein ACRET8_09115 [Burkholderiales bacterium]
MKSSFRIVAPIMAGALLAASAFAHASTAKEDMAQLTADKAALQRQIKRMDSDQARLKSDLASGRMSAESKDAYDVYLARQTVTGEKTDIAHDKAASLQMKADKEALQRQVKRLTLAEARLKSDTAEGKMAAESKDAEKLLKDKQAVKAEEKQVSADHSKLNADERKK